MLLQEEEQSRNNPTMVEADGAHANEPAFDEFVPLVVVRHSLELFCRNQTRDL
jgi:hypothetical protein